MSTTWSDVGVTWSDLNVSWIGDAAVPTPTAPSHIFAAVRSGYGQGAGVRFHHYGKK